MTFIKDKNGQWAHPGKNTLIPDAGGRITMRGVNQPVLGIDDLGNQTVMMPGGEYQFPGNSVYEIPLVKNGGGLPGKQVPSNEPSWRELYYEWADVKPDNIDDIDYGDFLKLSDQRKMDLVVPSIFSGGEYQTPGQGRILQMIWNIIGNSTKYLLLNPSYV